MQTKLCSIKNSKDRTLTVLEAKIDWLNSLIDRRFGIYIYSTRGSSRAEQILKNRERIEKLAEDAEFFYGNPPTPVEYN